ncbi:hypothetical protein Tco_0576147 [Tanacetum coccineum]
MSSWTSCLAPTLPIYTDLSRDGQSLLGANDVEGYRREGISLAFIVLGPEDPQTPPVPQDEEEREPMFVQAHNHRYSARTYIPEYIPLEDMDMSLVGSRQEDPDRSATRMMRQRMVRLTDPVVTGGDVVPPPYQLTIILGTRITGSECNLLAVHGPTCTFIHLLTTIILGDPTQIQTSVIASHSRLLLMPSLPALPSPSIYNISIHTSTCDRRDDVLSYPEQPPPRQYGWWKGGCTYMPFYSERIGLTRPRIDSSDALGASGPIADDLVFASGPELDQRLSRRLDETDRRRQDQMVETLRVIRDMRNESYEQTCQTELIWRLEFSKIQDTANSGGKKETKAMVFHQMDTKEVSDRFVAPCFVNGMEAYDWEINLGVEENMISNEYAVKLCLEHEVKRGNKLVKKELIVALRGEIYFVKFIINPEEDDVEHKVILGRSFLRMTKAITNFGLGTVIIFPEFYPFLEDIEEEEKSLDDWDHLLDFNLDGIPLLGEEELPPFVCKMRKRNRNKKKAMENLNFLYQDIGTSSSAGGNLTQEEAAKEALAIRISQKFALLEEVRLVIETIAYHDKYKKVLNEIWKDKVELDGKIIKEKEEAIKRIKGEALKEKDDPKAFIFPIRLEGKVNKNALADTGSDINTMSYRIYETLWREEMKKVDRGITMINHTQAEVMGMLTNVLCQVGVTIIIVKSLSLDIPIDRDAPIVVGRGFLFDVLRIAKSDSDDEEEYQIKRNKFRAPIYGLKPAPYSNCNDLAERSLALQAKPDYEGCYTKEEEEATGRWRTEIKLTDPYGNIYLQGFTTKKTDRKLSKYHKLSDIMSPNLWEHPMMRPDYQDPNALDNMKPWKRYCSHKFIMSSCYGKDATEMRSLGCDGEIDNMLMIKLREAKSNEEIFNYVAWIRAFNINEPIYVELCHEFYSTFEFNEVCTNDELQTKKIIKFRLGGRAHSLTLLEFAHRLGLYHADELEEDGFNVYFEGGLRSDEHFNA